MCAEKDFSVSHCGTQYGVIVELKTESLRNSDAKAKSPSSPPRGMFVTLLIGFSESDLLYSWWGPQTINQPVQAAFHSTLAAHCRSRLMVHTSRVIGDSCAISRRHGLTMRQIFSIRLLVYHPCII